MAPRASAVLLVLLFVAFPAASAATPPAPGSGGPAAQSTVSQERAYDTTTFLQELRYENTTLRLQLQPNGDAHWTVTDRYAIDDQNDTRAFEQHGTEYTDGGLEQNLADQFRAASEAAGRATGREMAVTNVTRNYRIEDGWGELRLSFTWTNFAAVDGSRLDVQDGFSSPSGTWLSGLSENQSLIVSPPPGYTLTNSPQNSYLQDRDLRIDGAVSFQPGDLDIVYEGNQPSGPTPTETATATATVTPGTETGGNSALWAGLALLFVVGLAAAVLYLNGQDEFPPVGGSDDADGGDDTPSPAAATGGDTTDTDDIDVELLSDEERVERLLTQNGGRMKQARIVKETGWSNAKVSQLLSSMDEADRIDKLRIGRENLISFPDEDVTEIED